jgi:hypothetical protein
LRPFIPPVENIVAKELELSALDLGAIVRPGDGVMWGQADAEPVPLTQALMAQRHAIGNFKVFLGITYSDKLTAEYADCIRFSAYCGSGGNRALAKAGKLDILPCHYSHLRELIASGRRTTPGAACPSSPCPPPPAGTAASSPGSAAR